ncbi:uncharacterized protein LOC100905193 [Galendromus occidentalis]|uniref:Uncharacterized protein LOC100905193 n=1 Tax=Galendromus occidentalis TaxID=34638 RepID=A0AAJ7PA09_9ACAR|nr:uncharacterized protein LOC100905193 [Galendromus occidentalis]
MPRQSPFFTFVRCYRDGEKRKGRHLSLDEARIEADPIWLRFSPSEKERFVEMAEAKSRCQPQRPPRVFQRPGGNTTMSPFRQKMRGFIERVFPTEADVKTHFFHSLSFHRESTTRLPSEISIVRFSLDRGAEHFLHFLFNPEVRFERFSLVKEKMKKQITVVPIEGTPGSDDNLREVLKAIHDFCGGHFYVHSNEIEAAIKCFCDLRKLSPGSRDLVPLDGEELIQMLWERSTDRRNAKISQVRDACSGRAGLDFLACEYHKATKTEGVCTLWKAYRLPYGCSQILAEPYDIDVAEGYHQARENWAPRGSYYEGTGNQEPWKFVEATSDWESRPSSSGLRMNGRTAHEEIPLIDEKLEKLKLDKNNDE